ncbi:MAG: S1 family peptidase, partial [Steroidobacteraceae bacterium]
NLPLKTNLALVLAFSALTAASAALLKPSVLRRVEAATFEVFQSKPTQEPLSYARPLPLDLLPYQERTDKYHSIGTAFALGHGPYVTSAHILMSGLDSLWGPPELRDPKGNVYPIDQVEKFGQRRDFAVFTVKGRPGDVALPLDTQPILNQPVYAIDNALGTGVVIRSGLYTSDTPEPLDAA